jgi:hypothetical protein
VAVRRGLGNLLLTRYVFAAKVVFRYCWHAGKLMARAGLAIATKLLSLASVQLGSSSIVEEHHAG